MEKNVLKVKDFYEALNAFAPFETCEKWDNSGLLSGSPEIPVTGIHCALDLSRRVLKEAIAENANLIVVHHPILFGGRKNLREDDEEGAMLCELIRNHIALISCHTNFDKAQGGVNDILAAKLGLTNIAPIEDDEEGYLRMGTMDAETLSDFAKQVRATLGDAVRVYGSPDAEIRKVAVCGGAGGEFAVIAKAAGADAYVTGEMRYHDSLDLAQAGFATLHCGHDATEKIAVETLANIVKAKAAEAGADIKVTESSIDSFSLHLM